MKAVFFSPLSRAREEMSRSDRGESAGAALVAALFHSTKVNKKSTDDDKTGEKSRGFNREKDNL